MPSSPNVTFSMAWSSASIVNTTAPPQASAIVRGGRSLLDEGFRFGGGAVVDGDVVTRLQQVCDHAASHVPQADESDLHGIHCSLFRASFGPLLAMMGG